MLTSAQVPFTHGVSSLLVGSLAWKTQTICSLCLRGTILEFAAALALALATFANCMELQHSLPSSSLSLSSWLQQLLQTQMGTPRWPRGFRALDLAPPLVRAFARCDLFELIAFVVQRANSRLSLQTCCSEAAKAEVCWMVVECCCRALK